MCAHEYTLMFHSLASSWTIRLALGTALMLGYFCDNIGLVLACLPSGSANATGSPSRYYDPAIRAPYLLSPVLFIHVGDPYIPSFLIRRISDLLVSPPFLFSLRHVYSKLSIYACGPTSSSPFPPLFPHCSITMRFH